MEYKLNKNGRATEVAMQGDFTFNDHEVFRELLTMLGSLNDTDSIVMNLRGLIFLDSAALGMLIIANDEAMSRKQKLIVSGPQQQVKMALDVADMKSILMVTE